MKIRVKNLNGSHFYSIWKIENVTRAGILFCALLVIAYCFWTLDRGFEITDEAYYLLLAMYADSVKVFISAQQWITAGLWHLTASIVLFRAAGMLLLLISSAFLAIGVFSTCLRLNLVAEDFGSESVVVAGSLVCGMLYASTINFSPCYNLLASTGAYGAAGFALLATNQSNFTYKYVLFALAGLAVGVEVLSKPSAGIATLGLIAIWGAIFERSLVHRIFGLVTIVFGTLTFAGVILLVNSKLSDARQAFEQGMQLFRMVQTETIWTRLVRYFIEFWEYFQATLIAFAIPIVAMIGYVTTRRLIFAKFGLIALMITLIFGSLVAGEPTFSLQNLSFDSYLFGGFNRYDVEITAIIAMLMMVLIVSIPVWTKDWSRLALIIGLIFLPYSVAMGTGNALFTQVIDSLAPWGVLVSMLLVAHHPDNLSKIPTTLIGICFIATIVLQIVTSNFRPYQISLSLTKQDQTATVGNIGRVKVDPETYKFLTEMMATVEECDIAAGAPFIGLYNIPGVALTIQAIPLLTPWLNNREQAEFVLERAHAEEMRSALVAFQMIEEGVFPPLPRQLSAFPSGYRYCGSAIYPYRQQRIQIWQSLAR